MTPLGTETPDPEPPVVTPDQDPPTPTNGFTITDSGTDWVGVVDGLVEVPTDRFTDDPGDCYLLIGELTPVGLTEGLTNNSFDTPRYGVLAGGEYVDSGTECDRTAAEELGYSWVLDAEAVPGTTIPIFVEIFVPAGQGAITDIVVGNPRSVDEFLTFDPVALPTVPQKSGLAVGATPPGVAVGQNAAFESADFSGTEWQGLVSEVVEVSVDRFTDEAGTCYLVLGTITPTVVDGLVTSGFDTPRIGGLAGGRYVDSGTECDTDSAEARGFDWILRAEVTQGTPYNFYVELFVPDSWNADLDSVIVGSPSGEDAVAFSR